MAIQGVWRFVLGRGLAPNKYPIMTWVLLLEGFRPGTSILVANMTVIIEGHYGNLQGVIGPQGGIS